MSEISMARVEAIEVSAEWAGFEAEAEAGNCCEVEESRPVGVESPSRPPPIAEFASAAPRLEEMVRFRLLLVLLPRCMRSGRDGPAACGGISSAGVRATLWAIPSGGQRRTEMPGLACAV